MAEKVNLKEQLRILLKEFPQIEAIYLFGSRAFGSGSIRSDIDLLVVLKEGSHLKSSNARNFIQTNCRALDVFILEGSKAISCMNDSFAYAASGKELIDRLGAQKLWDSTAEFSEPVVGWVHEVSEHASFPPTALPNSYLDECSLDARLAKAEAAGLPVRPYIGDSIDKVTAQIIDVIAESMISPSELCARSSARGGWTQNLASEYDCQDLIYITLKPWLRSVPREEITIRYDGQDKIADFNLFESQLIIEVKFVDSDGKKREVIKTLEGLVGFYKQNANVRCLLMLIYYTIDDIDAARWEADYTYFTTSPRVITKLIKIKS